jgi:hypothetical protein
VPEPSGRGSLTDALLAPPVPVDRAEWQRAVAAVPEQLAGLATRRSGAGPCRLTDYEIRLALGRADEAELPRAREPFAWSARTARRALGLAAVRALAAGETRSPSEGVRDAVAQATQLVHEARQPPSAMDRWLAGLPPAGRAAVGAEAVTWATRLWCALDWQALPAPLAIGRDHWWDSPHSSLLALRGRAEVRTGSSHLVLLAGPRRDSIRAELSVVALVEALRGRGTTGPGPVVGWWADSGHLVRVEGEPALLRQGVATVGQALSGRVMGAAA